MTKLLEGLSETEASELCKRGDKCVGRNAGGGRGKERLKWREGGWCRALNNQTGCSLAARIARWAWSAPAARASSSHSLCPCPCQVFPPSWVAGLAAVAAALPLLGSGAGKTSSVIHFCLCRSALESMAKFYLKGKKCLKNELSGKLRKREKRTVKSALMWFLFFKSDLSG